jgi:hypothetical protein
MGRIRGALRNSRAVVFRQAAERVSEIGRIVKSESEAVTKAHLV